MVSEISMRMWCTGIHPEYLVVVYNDANFVHRQAMRQDFRNESFDVNDLDDRGWSNAVQSNYAVPLDAITIRNSMFQRGLQQ